MVLILDEVGLENILIIRDGVMMMIVMIYCMDFLKKFNFNIIETV
jgi:hypothetical protein